MRGHDNEEAEQHIHSREQDKLLGKHGHCFSTPPLISNKLNHTHLVWNSRNYTDYHSKTNITFNKGRYHNYTPIWVSLRQLFNRTGKETEQRNISSFKNNTSRIIACLQIVYFQTLKQVSKLFPNADNNFMSNLWLLQLLARELYFLELYILIYIFLRIFITTARALIWYQTCWLLRALWSDGNTNLILKSWESPMKADW